jgi:alcohol dehydrogenase class IV
MKSFAYTSRTQRIVFGAGTLSGLADELVQLKAQRALVLCTPGQRAQAEALAAQLGDRAVGVFDQARMHVPIETAQEARALARHLQADCAVALGGGSTIGLGKAIALESGLPVIAIPTTYAGSEMTPIFGVTEKGVKRTGRDPRVLPRTVVYDPELSYSLPVDLSITSALNAIAHAAEGLYAIERNPISDLMAQEGVAALARAIPVLSCAPAAASPAQPTLQARFDALYGAWLCGAVLGSVSVALHHKLCHTLGGSFDLPHAETHSIVLPHALAYNAPAAPDAMRRIAMALGTDATTSAPQALYDLARSAGIPTALRDIGMRAADLDRACALTLQNQYPNPRALEAKALRQLLQDAFEGTRPAAVPAF